MEEDSFKLFLIDYLPSLFSASVGFSALHIWATCDIIYSKKKKKLYYPSLMSIRFILYIIPLSHSKEIPSLSSKGFLSRNTLEVQPSFRNSLLNTVLYCKPQLAIILFYLPHYLVSEPSRLILSLCTKWWTSVMSSVKIIIS